MNYIDEYHKIKAKRNHLIPSEYPKEIVAMVENGTIEVEEKIPTEVLLVNFGREIDLSDDKSRWIKEAAEKIQKRLINKG